MLTLLNVASGKKFVLPPPPYLIAATATAALTTINLNSYVYGGISSSPSHLFKIIGAGLLPIGWFVDVLLSSNLEISNDGGATWISSDTIFYLLDNFDTGFVYKVRLKTGLTSGIYNETITIMPDSGANVPPYIIQVNCTVAVDTDYIVATGGDYSFTSGDYKFLVFNNSNNLSITKSSLTQQAELFIVGGGGGGGNSFASHGGGGGGGGGGFLNITNFTVATGTFPIIIGSGGAAGDGSHPVGYNGNNSVALGYTAIGGGGGGQGDSISFYNNNGANGGSGGGAGSYFSAGGSPTAGQGYSGGNTIGFAVDAGSGGGGAGSIGHVGVGITGGSGGVGISNSMNGILIEYSKGGQGGQPSAPLIGASNTGSGGSGSYGGGGEQRAGGSGIFVFIFKFQN